MISARERKRQHRRLAKDQHGLKLFFTRFFKISLLLLTIIFLASLVFVIYLKNGIKTASFNQNILFASNNLASQQDKIYLAIVRGSNDKMTIFAFPGDLDVDLIGDYGSYPLRSVLPLLQIEKKDHQLIKSVFSFGLDILIDQVWSSDQSFEIKDKASLQNLVKKSIYSAEIDTGLSRFDRLKLFALIDRLRADQIDFKNVTNQQAWFDYLGNRLAQVQEPDCTLAVINATGKARLATKISTILENNGSSVIRTDDVSEKKEKSQILLNPESAVKCQQTVASILQLFPFKVEIAKSKISVEQYRSDLVIYAGDDFKQLWSN